MKRISPSIYPFWKQTTAKRKPIDNPFKRKYQIPLETWAMEDFVLNDNNRSNSKNQNNSIIKYMADGVSNASRNIADGVVNVSQNIADRLAALAKGVYHNVKKMLPYYVNTSTSSTEPEVLLKQGSEGEDSKHKVKQESESGNSKRMVVPAVFPMLYRPISFNMPDTTSSSLMPVTTSSSSSLIPVTTSYLKLKHDFPLNFLNIPRPTSPWDQISPNLDVYKELQKFIARPSFSQLGTSPAQDDASPLQSKALILHAGEDNDGIKDIPKDIDSSDVSPKPKEITPYNPDHIINDENIHMPQTKQEIAQFRKQLGEFKKEYNEIMHNEMSKPRAIHLAERTLLYNKYNSLMQIFDAMVRAQDPQYADFLSRKDEIDYYRDVLSSKPPKLLKTLEDKYYKILYDSSKIIENPKTITDMEEKNKQPMEMLRNIEEVHHQLQDFLKFEKRPKRQIFIKRQMKTLSKIYEQLHDTFYRFYYEFDD